MLPGSRGRMDFRVRGSPIARWAAPKIGSQAWEWSQTGLVSGVFCSTGLLLRQLDVFSRRSRCERIDFDCP